jgi:hypothetical protein
MAKQRVALLYQALFYIFYQAHCLRLLLCLPGYLFSILVVE